MKPRNKEVNIFNMSLLDILCGALGAFCFMMLVLFQYWKPEGPETTKVKVDTAQMEQKIQDLLKQMKNMSNLPPEAAARMKQLEEDFARLQQMTNQLKAQLQQAQAQTQAYKRQADQARAELDDSKKELQKFKNRNPVTVVLTTTSAAHDVDLYVQDSKMDKPDVAKVQGVKWNGDVFYNAVRGPASDVWMMRDAPAGEYKVYYKFLEKGGNPGPARVEGYYLHNSSIVRMPAIEIANDHQVASVGSIMVKPDMSSGFKPTPEYAEAYQRMIEQLGRRNQGPAPQKKQ
ncbi:MAG: hypothetical protein HY820_20405 [Acidobacteria bacterium]|nr:hypothetical protein [Acidobacteriota bacterium]